KDRGKLVGWVLFPGLLILLAVSAGAVLWVYHLLQGLPDERVIRGFTPKAVTTVYDKDGDVLTTIYEDKNQTWVPLFQISDAVKKAVIATEDPSFLQHGGINYRQTWESIKDNLKEWRWIRGGSTITQQVAKNVYLSGEKTLTRKIKEYFLAKRIESVLSKQRILEIYLNEVGWGYGIYGVELAARFYLDKPAAELNTAEAALLAAMLRNPAVYNPYKTIERVTKRAQLVLTLMQRHHLITREEYDEAVLYTIELRRDKPQKRFASIGLDRHEGTKETIPCYAQFIENYLLQTLGPHLLYDVGRAVRTTIDDKVQGKIEEVIREVEGDEERADASPVKIGLLLENGSQVRAIGCSPAWEEAAEKIRGLGPPFDSYMYYRVMSEQDIAWKDIVLIAAEEILL
ncbi:MAG: transglycosylase domain-containing protein, partial [Nitrospirota bacterium]|nr:transglycosylase domain-containing protein [Nitrospirota bacterium]